MAAGHQMRAYALVTLSYWSFTVTDGALRMLVLLYFHDLGFSPISLAFLFLLYELFGVFTNLVGGWVGALHGLQRTLIVGLGLQVVALGLLSLHEPAWAQWLAVAWVMGCQALSGIAKDLTKMSSKSALKYVVGQGSLFKLVAVLTGSKNALKGVGFFVGAALLAWRGFDQALLIMAAALAVVFVVVVLLIGDLGQPKSLATLSSTLTKSAAVSRLSLARFFLFASRDIWFVVALPVFLDEQLGWTYEAIGGFLALWVIGYGIVQSLAPQLLRGTGSDPQAAAAFLLPMAGIAIVIAVADWSNTLQALLTVLGLLAFGTMFALTSSVHSYLILAYSKGKDETPLDVGFYYSANAAGRLVGTLLSGVLYLVGGLGASLMATAAFLGVALVVSLGLPEIESSPEGTSHVAMS